MRRALAALCALFLLTTAGTCGDEPTTTAIVGSYTLVSVNGHALPAPFENTTITGGSVTVNANNTFTYVENRVNNVTQTITGTWSVSGSTYTFHPTSEQDGSDATGVLSGTTLTINTSEQVLVYHKN